MTDDNGYDEIDKVAMELADRFESSGQFPQWMTRKEFEAAAMGYVMGVRHVLDSLGLEFVSFDVFPDGVQA